MINKVILVGRLTRDPQSKTTSTGATVSRFTIALNRNFNSSDGQKADFINCSVWNKQAENVNKFCHKGSLVGIEGRLRSNTYTNAQGQKVYTVEVKADYVQFLDTKNTKTDKEIEDLQLDISENNFQYYDENMNLNNQNTQNSQNSQKGQNSQNKQNNQNNRNNQNRQQIIQNTNGTQTQNKFVINEKSGDDLNGFDIFEEDLEF